MSQEKAQLIAPLGIVTFSGVTATGVITASSLSGNITGAASSIVQGSSITAGVVTASSFAGNLTGNIQRLADSGPNISVGVVTATSFSGNLTGSVTDLTATPDITVGIVTATRLKTAGTLTGDVTGNITGDVTGVATGNVTGNVDGNITGNVTGTIAGNVTGNVTGNASGHAGGLGINYNGGWAGAGTSQISVGVITATSFYGDGSTLDGVSGGPVSAQSVTINGASTSIDLSSGNVIYATQSADTTVSFANSENGNVYFIRTKDDNTTARSITWPSSLKWENGETPTLLSNPRPTDAQIFLLVTRDEGVTWYGKEVVNLDPQTFGLFSWGKNGPGWEGGVLGLNDLVNRSSPTQIGTDTTWSKWTAGQYSGGRSIKTDGTLWTWGWNNNGQQGQNTQGTPVSISSPTQVGTDTNWASITSNGYHSVATRTDGSLWTWGSGGVTGLNNTTAYSSPTQIPGSWSTDPNKLSSAGEFVGAIKTDGSLWTWGYNIFGNLGINNASNNHRSSPIQVGTDTTWRTINGGSSWSALATKTDGTLWGWGYNEEGELGKNDAIYGYSSPIQVGTDTTWDRATIMGDGKAGLGQKTDGTLWMWGKNQYGQLGQNSTISRSSPTQIGTETTWDRVVAGGDHVFGTKTDGTLWTWGRGHIGQLGKNSEVSYSSPTQVPGTAWSLDGCVQSNGYTSYVAQKL